MSRQTGVMSEYTQMILLEGPGGTQVSGQLQEVFTIYSSYLRNNMNINREK